MPARYIGRRIGQAVITLVLATVVSFSLLHIVPGDPARLMLGDQASRASVAALRRQLGLDSGLPTQYWHYLTGLFHGNLGTSLTSRGPVLSLIGSALPHTLLLVASALTVAVAVGLPLGVAAALHPRSAGSVAHLASLVGQSVPNFWLAVMAILVLSVDLKLFPTSGYGGVDHLVLPTLALAPFLMAVVIRVTRQSVLDVVDEQYVQTASAKGLHRHTIVYRHILKNALPSVITVVALYAAGMVGGAVPVEVVFAWPGIGQLAVNSLEERDYPVIQGVVLVSAMIFVLVNLIVDLLYLVLDPRTRFE